MLAGSSTAAPTISSDPSHVVSPPGSRPPRRRGLSYLRSFGLDSTRSSTPSDSEARPRNRRSRTTNDIASTQLGWGHSFGVDTSLATPDASASRQLSNDVDMARTRSHFGLDGAGVSTANEFSHRMPPIPIRASNSGNTDSAREALLSRVDGMNTNMPAPSIQFIPAVDSQRTQRPSLDFKRVTRILPTPNSIIKVGRYSEKDNGPEIPQSAPSDAPIGFKSKVVSRRHCEFSCSNGQWYIKDVKSSSGTFLNHIRLSQPGMESKLFPVTDGDVVQLGIDFKGGEEMIFRCVKIRVELNRGWQRGLNKFNKSTHKQLQSLAKGKAGADSDAASKHSTDCTICLNSIAPCQALFVAPCSHTWHFKCIRGLLDNCKNTFLCPNCRAQADLNAEIEDEELEDFDDFDVAEFDGPARAVLDINSTHRNGTQSTAAAGEPPTTPGSLANNILDEQEPRHTVSPVTEPDSPSLFNTDDLAWTLNTMSLRQNSGHLASLDDTIHAFPAANTSRPLTAISSNSDSRAGSSGMNGSSLNPSASAFVPSPSTSPRAPVPVPNQRPEAMASAGLSELHDAPSPHSRSNTLNASDMLNGDRRLASSEALHREGPMTPRNAAGPFVFDGAGRTGSTRNSEQRDRDRDTTLMGTDTE